MATNEMTIKLMIDTESNTLIFAEASKDFVDFLIFLLSLPIGTVIKLLTNESMAGSIGNIFTSVAKLDEAYLRPNVNKYNILNPMVFSSLAKIPMSDSTRSSIRSSREFFTCSDPKCKQGITDMVNLINGAQCPGCLEYMNRYIEFIDKDSEGYVQDIASYMISDDLSVTPISTMSIVSKLSKFNVSKLEERNVKIGNKEALEVLESSLLSTTVLTDVFLKRKKRKRAGDGEKGTQIFIWTQTGTTITLKIRLSVTICYLKSKLDEITGISSKHSRLIFNGQALKDDGLTLADYNVVENSTIHLMLSLRGC